MNYEVVPASIDKYKGRILIVEDELTVLEVLREQVEDLNYEVVAIADTGSDAIAEFFCFEPDLILMDVQLKGPMDGIVAAKKIRSRRPVPIVFLSGNQDRAILDKAKVVGESSYMHKPYDLRELENNIEFALSKFREDKERVNLEKTLLNLEKLGTIGSFAAGMIHDIREPLGVVSSYGVLIENSDSEVINSMPLKEICGRALDLCEYKALSQGVKFR